MPVKVINSFEEFTKLINGDVPVVIDFWATWCGPCRAISPVLEKMSDFAEFAGVEFYKIDVDDHQDISEEVGIRAMPTFIAFQKGNKIKELVGANPAALKTLVESAKTLV